MSITPEQLKEYAVKKAKLVTDKPITFKIEKLPKKTAARTFTYYSSVHPRTITRFGVSINEVIYNEYKERPHALRQLVLHELAHLKSYKTGYSHGKHFKEAARELGVKRLLES